MQTLLWVGHESDILKKVAEFYRHEIYMDCTFLVEGQYLRGHKTILCACSTFFQELFKTESGSKAISLKNVKFSDLKSILNFIYFGVVDIPFSQVTSFLNTSNLLQIKGLEEFFNTENIDKLAETTGALPSSAHGDGHSLIIKSEAQDEERNEMTAPINVNEEFLLAEDRDEYSDVNDDVHVRSECDLKSENGMDIVESSLPASYLEVQMENSEGEEDSVDILDDSVLHPELDVKTETGEELHEASFHLASDPGHPSNSGEESDGEAGEPGRLAKRKRTPCSAERPSAREQSAGFSVEASPQRRQRAQTGERPFPCDQCPASLSSKTSLLRHQRTHTGERPFACNQCQATFSCKGNLQKHQRTHTGERPFACNRCHASFTRKCHLQDHQRTHKGERRFACNRCPATFIQKSHLRVHERTHTGERTYACNLCPATFIQMSSLQAHQLTHAGERRFACKQCPATFIHKPSLRAHEQTHTGERPFACNQCPATFFRRSHLRYHQRTHTGERPYACTLCPATFVQKAHLTTHQLTHTGERAYKCDICSSAFASKGTVARHILTHMR